MTTHAAIRIRNVKPIQTLPPVPEIRLRRIAREPEPKAFLTLQRRWLVARYPDGTESQAFGYDSMTRRALDAVVIVVWRRVDGEVCVYLRTAVRPPLLEREAHPGAVDREHEVCLWELPAGLIEPEDLDDEPNAERRICRAAAREAEEELGFSLGIDRFSLLGAGVFPCPAMIAERQFFARAEVTQEQPTVPSLDGSPLEEHATICLISLSRALEYCERGSIVDGKTELALRRFSACMNQKG
jgi:8-oxo-dGTP pyrophosphatase MutT (NUDIX family)